MLLYSCFSQCQLDLNFSQEIPVTFKLVEGTGPVHLTAQHMVGEYHEKNRWVVGPMLGWCWPIVYPTTIWCRKITHSKPANLYIEHRVGISQGKNGKSGTFTVVTFMYAFKTACIQLLIESSALETNSQVKLKQNLQIREKLGKVGGSSPNFFRIFLFLHTFKKIGYGGGCFFSDFDISQLDKTLKMHVFTLYCRIPTGEPRLWRGGRWWLHGNWGRSSDGWRDRPRGGAEEKKEGRATGDQQEEGRCNMVRERKGRPCHWWQSRERWVNYSQRKKRKAVPPVTIMRKVGVVWSEKEKEGRATGDNKEKCGCNMVRERKARPCHWWQSRERWV